MQALLVIDIQEEYFGAGRDSKRYPYPSDALIPRINRRIAEYQAENAPVAYITNRYYVGREGFKRELAAELSIASDIRFDKTRASCFSNPALMEWLSQNSITDIEIVGADGNYCAGMSALDGRKNGLNVTFDLSMIGVANSERFPQTLKRLEKAGVNIVQSTDGFTE